MQSFRAATATPRSRTALLLALAGFADEVAGTLARLFAYVGLLALIAILALYGLDQLPAIDGPAGAAPSDNRWSEAGRSQPAFAVSLLDPLEKTEPYTILRHPEGGRRDVLRWSRDGKPLAELQIYRPGGEFDASLSPAADLSARMGVEHQATMESAGLLDSKFGTVALLEPATPSGEARSCLGFFRKIDDPRPRAFRLVVPRREPAGAARGNRLHPKPSDLAQCGQRAETHRVVRPRRAQAQGLRSGPHGGLGHRHGKSPPARHALSGIKPSRWFSSRICH